MTEADEDIGNVLQAIYAVPHRERVCHAYWRITRPERFHAVRSCKFYSSWEGTFYPGEIRLEAISEKDWHSAGLTKYGTYCLDLLVVNGRPRWVLGVYRAIR